MNAIQIIGIEGISKEAIAKINAIAAKNKKDIRHLYPELWKLEIDVKTHSLNGRSSYTVEISARRRSGIAIYGSDSAFEPIKAVQKAFENIIVKLRRKLKTEKQIGQETRPFQKLKKTANVQPNPGRDAKPVPAQ